MDCHEGGEAVGAGPALLMGRLKSALREASEARRKRTEASETSLTCLYFLVAEPRPRHSDGQVGCLDSPRALDSVSLRHEVGPTDHSRVDLGQRPVENKVLRRGGPPTVRGAHRPRLSALGHIKRRRRVPPLGVAGLITPWKPPRAHQIRKVVRGARCPGKLHGHQAEGGSVPRGRSPSPLFIEEAGVPREWSKRRHRGLGRRNGPGTVRAPAGVDKLNYTGGPRPGRVIAARRVAGANPRHRRRLRGGKAPVIIFGTNAEPRRGSRRSTASAALSAGPARDLASGRPASLVHEKGPTKHSSSGLRGNDEIAAHRLLLFLFLIRPPKEPSTQGRSGSSRERTKRYEDRRGSSRARAQRGPHRLWRRSRPRR